MPQRGGGACWRPTHWPDLAGDGPVNGADGDSLSARVVSAKGGFASERGVVRVVEQKIAVVSSRGVVPLLLNLAARSPRWLQRAF